MKLIMITTTIIAAVSAATTGKKSDCPETVEIIGHSVFDQMLDGSYKNILEATITQNEEDKAWFIIGLENHEIIVSFDGAECPQSNKKWHQLELNEIKYNEISLDVKSRNFSVLLHLTILCQIF